jgi:phenylpropionate dioxygenase-like ring-hydroxylating dioxygenase large terminal subunit
MTSLLATPSPSPHQVDRFHWRNAWYPIAFVVDIPRDRPYGFSIYGEPFVLFQNQSEKWGCLRDRCPHRAAKLSDGQLIDGHVECLYHGWQFSPEGNCAHIPQLEAKATIPKTVCTPAFIVTECQGILWVWPGDVELAHGTVPPQVADLNAPGVAVFDTLTDLPYDHSLLVENLLDPAHVYISHDRTELNIRREHAQALEMQVLATHAQGFEGQFRGTQAPNPPWTKLDFMAPGLVHYQFTNKAVGVIAGLALHALPIAPGKSRILVRRYANFFKPAFKLKPLWLEHLRQNKILEEDLLFIVEQQRYLEQSGLNIQQAYQPLMSLDTFVIAHRKWLDEFGKDIPWYQGYKTIKLPEQAFQTPAKRDLPSRFERHTQQCGTCRKAYQRTQQIYRGAMVGAIAFASLALLIDGWGKIMGVIGFAISAMMAGMSHQLKQHFEQTFERRSNRI